MPSVIPQGLFAPKADGIGIVDDFSNTPTAKILWRFLNLTHGTKGATKMKRLLTAGIFGTILGIVSAGTTNASIVSSGFLDEKLTEYALSTSLDLKANQTDLTALSNKIGNDWPFNSDMMAGLHYLVSEFYPPEISLKNTSDLVHFLFGGALESGVYRNAAGVLNFLGEKIINVGDYEFLSGKVLDGFRSLTQLTNGWTSTDGTTYLGLKDINTKIADLPKEYATVGAALTAIKGIAEDAKAAALAAIPDPKQEGSSGKFVLTVDIVGDNATYHWEKIDREGETTTTE